MAQKIFEFLPEAALPSPVSPAASSPSEEESEEEEEEESSLVRMWWSPRSDMVAPSLVLPSL